MCQGVSRLSRLDTLTIVHIYSCQCVEASVSRCRGIMSRIVSRCRGRGSASHARATADTQRSARARHTSTPWQHTRDAAQDEPTDGLREPHCVAPHACPHDTRPRPRQYKRRRPHAIHATPRPATPRQIINGWLPSALLLSGTLKSNKLNRLPSKTQHLTYTPPK